MDCLVSEVEMVSGFGSVGFGADRLHTSLALYSAHFAGFSGFQCTPPASALPHFLDIFTQGSWTPTQSITARTHLRDQQRCTHVPRLPRPRRRSCTRARSSTLRSDVYLNTFKTRFRFQCVRAPAWQAAALLPSPLPANHMAAARHAP